MMLFKMFSWYEVHHILIKVVYQLQFLQRSNETWHASSFYFPLEINRLLNSHWIRININLWPIHHALQLISVVYGSNLLILYLLIWCVQRMWNVPRESIYKLLLLVLYYVEESYFETAEVISLFERLNYLMRIHKFSIKIICMTSSPTNYLIYWKQIVYCLRLTLWNKAFRFIIVPKK